MAAKETLTINGKAVEELHRGTLKWISRLYFTKDEMIFIEKLLNSYIFEPTTPNLFERLQDYLSRLKLTNKNLDQLENDIHKHESELGGIIECHALPRDLYFIKYHQDLGTRVEEFEGKFQMLKSEIFNYAGGILKRRKK